MNEDWFGLPMPTLKKKKGGGSKLKERISKSPAAEAYRATKRTPKNVWDWGKESAKKQQSTQHPKKQVKKIVGGAGHLIAHQDKPFSSIAKGLGFKKRRQ